MDDLSAEPAEPTIYDVAPIPVGAGFGIRVAARLVDFAFTFVLSIGCGIIVGVVCGVMQAMGRLPENWQEHLDLGLPINIALGVIAGLLYQAISEGIGSVSLGKLVCGLRVMQVDGRPCTMEGALERNILYPIDGMFFGLIAWASMSQTPLRQRYGDRWGKTVVVERKLNPALPPLTPWKVWVGILLASVSWAALITAMNLVHVLRVTE
jgi:uncharacterized RDD family membrane protein YckC